MQHCASWAPRISLCAVSFQAQWFKARCKKMV
jgi:hypothetical protein